MYGTDKEYLKYVQIYKSIRKRQPDQKMGQKKQIAFTEEEIYKNNKLKHILTFISDYKVQVYTFQIFNSQVS